MSLIIVFASEETHSHSETYSTYNSREMETRLKRKLKEVPPATTMLDATSNEDSDREREIQELTETIATLQKEREKLIRKSQLQHSMENIQPARPESRSRQLIKALKEIPSSSRTNSNRALQEIVNSQLDVNTVSSLSDQFSPVWPHATEEKKIATIKPEPKELLGALPKFGGDVLEWQSFYESYTTTTRDFNVTNDVNIQRLSKALTGQARRLVDDHLNDGAFTQYVIDTLMNKYGAEGVLSMTAKSEARGMVTLDSKLKRLGEFTRQITRLSQMVKKHEEEMGTSTTLGHEVIILAEEHLPSNMLTTWKDYQRETRRCRLPEFVRFLERKRDNLINSTVPNNEIKKERRSPRHSFTDMKARRRTPHRRKHVSQRDKRGGRNYEENRVRKRGSRTYNNEYVYRDMVQVARDKFNSTPDLIPPRQSVTNNESKLCLLGCSVEHELPGCPIFMGKPYEERYDIIMMLKVCRRCAGGHKGIICDPN